MFDAIKKPPFHHGKKDVRDDRAYANYSGLILYNLYRIFAILSIEISELF